MATNAQYTTVFNDFARWLAQYRQTQTYLRHHEASDILVYPRFENLDIGGSRATGNGLEDWKFNGLEFGVNTDDDGRLYAVLTDGGGGTGHTVSVYKDSAKANKVAEGTANDNATATLAEQGSSGLSGTVEVGVVTANDEIELIILDPFLHRANKFDTDDSDKDYEELQNKSVAGQSDVCESVEDSIVSMLSAIQAGIEEFSILGVMKEVLGATSQNVIEYDYTIDANGAVSLEYDGVLRTLFDEMTADGKAILQNTPAAGALTAASGNTGTLTGTTITAHDHCYDGDTITVRCTKGLDSTREEFIVESNILGQARNILTVEENWIDASLGIALKLDRSITDAGAQAAAVASWVINGETSSNTDSGVLYGRIEQAAGVDYIWLWTSSADRDADDTTASTLVASGSVTDAGAGTTLSFTQQNSSGLSGSVSVTYAADGNFDVDLNACAEGDRWTIALTNDYAGKLLTVIGHLWHISLPHGIAASAEMADDIVKIPADYLRETDL